MCVLLLDGRYPEAKKKEELLNISSLTLGARHYTKQHETVDITWPAGSHPSSLNPHSSLYTTR